MFGMICNIRNNKVIFKKCYEIFKRSGEEYMTERKVIKVKRQAIRRARFKKVGTVAAMLPLVMTKGAPVATLKMDKCKKRTTDEYHWRLLLNVTHCGSDVTFGKWSTPCS